MADRNTESISVSHIPQRMCVICRRRFSKAQLIRHILGPNGELLADERKTRPGRGWYCCTGQACQSKFAKFRPKTGKRSRG